MCILFYPILTCCIELRINAYFDQSTPIVRETVVVAKRENRSRSPRGQQRVNYYVYLKSWRPDMDRIEIKLGKNGFVQFGQGDHVTVRTKSGFLGLEYLCENL